MLEAVMAVDIIAEERGTAIAGIAKAEDLHNVATDLFITGP